MPETKKKKTLSKQERKYSKEKYIKNDRKLSLMVIFNERQRKISAVYLPIKLATICTGN